MLPFVVTTIYSGVHDHESLKGSGTMIAIGDKVVVTMMKLYDKPASLFIIAAVSVKMAVRMLPHSTNGKVWLFYSVAGKVILANGHSHA